MRKTKIVITVGPASREAGTIERLIEAGVDVFRLNFSHGTQDEHAEVIARVRSAAAHCHRPVAILQDLAGPKIRTGPIAGDPVTLSEGQTITLTNRDVPGDASEVGLTWPDLPRNVQAGDTLMLADGALQLRVEATTDRDVRCTVVVGGELGSHKGINLPGRSLNVPILTAKDRDDLSFGLREGVDLIAASFVRTAHDVRTVLAAIAEGGQSTPLIAKIEKFEALEAIDEILALVHGIMVARGDLGVEIPIEKVPGAQKHLIAAANRAGKPVITATQMLKSMVTAARPTRAEVTDVANAILDGTDAIMLSEETAIGEHPVLVVQTMARIAAEVEKGFPHALWLHDLAPGTTSPAFSYPEAVARAACEMARDIGAAAIITCTQSGSTTQKVASYRPAQHLLAMTPAEVTRRQLALVWGAVPLELDAVDDFETMERLAIACALRDGLVQPGQPVVLVAGLPLKTRGVTNLIKVCTAEWS